MNNIVKAAGVLSLLLVLDQLNRRSVGGINCQRWWERRNGIGSKGLNRVGEAYVQWLQSKQNRNDYMVGMEVISWPL